MVAEIVDGQLYVTPRPAIPDANARSVLCSDLNRAFHRTLGDPKGPGGWWILDEPELHLGENVVVPDLAGWRRATMPILAKAVGFTQPPHWVCEVISPSTAVLDRTRKMGIYARAGVDRLWIVDPILRTLETYVRSADARWIVAAAFGDDDQARAEPFDAIEIDLRRCWLES
jgi:Uma2 family endonuclease